MPDLGGRVHPRVPDHRCGRGHPVQTGDRGAVAPGEPARCAAVHALGHGSESVSQAILEWIAHAGIATVLNDPGKPWQNGTDESFNGKFRDECLSIEWFRSRREAAVLIEAWRNHYNEVRPHSSLQYLTPSDFKQELRLEL